MQPGYTACPHCQWPIRAADTQRAEQQQEREAEEATPSEPPADGDDRAEPGQQAAPAAALPSAVHCPRCSTQLQVTVFPALFEDRAGGSAGERIADDREASCFYHESRKAVIACDRCGRFLCELCDLPMGTQHLCSTCLEGPTADQEDKSEVTAGKGTLLYDSIALSLAILPVAMCFYPTIMTAPIVLFLVIWQWKRQSSVVPRSRWRFVLAGILAGLQLGVWILVFWSIFFFWVFD